MANTNYLIGSGERLVAGTTLPSSWGPTKSVYNFNEVYSRTMPQWLFVRDQALELPEAACPRDRTVFKMMLHPKYLAMSYYPDQLFRSLQLEPIGSRVRKVVPHKPRKQDDADAGKEDVGPEYFVSVARKRLSNIVNQLGNLNEEAKNDFTKIEEISFLGAERIKVGEKPIRSRIIWEAVLQGDAEYIKEGFKDYLEQLEIKAHWDNVFHVNGLWFIAINATLPDVRRGVGLFSFLRAIRPMPSLRPLNPIFRQTQAERVEIPEDGPLDDQVRVAVLDGGLPDQHGLDNWVNYREPPGLGPADPGGLGHGMMVTSAFLFGPIAAGNPLDTPPCRVDHWRVVEQQDAHVDDPGLFRVLRRIEDILDQNTYDLVNLSLGPNLPIEDDDPHAWTAVLDRLISGSNTLLCAAAGNNGELDWDSGNARVQPPSDTVNGLGIGAASTTSDGWKRANYSCVGPGRRPGFVKPDILAFGGSQQEPFGVLDQGGTVGFTAGTSFASPYAARLAMGVATFFQSELSALALKALMIQRADNNGFDQREVGWGRLPIELEDMVASADHQAHILYQGVLGDQAGWSLRIPMPDDPMGGRVEIKATICFRTAVDAHHPLSYTRAGLEVVFRPNTVEKPGISKPFFKNDDYWPPEIELRRKAMKWEPVLKASKRFLGKTLHDPIFELHYLNRAEGQRADRRFELPYAAVITVTAPRVEDLYNQIINRYRLQLAPLRPRVRIRDRLRV